MVTYTVLGQQSVSGNSRLGDCWCSGSELGELKVITLYETLQLFNLVCGHQVRLTASVPPVHL